MAYCLATTRSHWGMAGVPVKPYLWIGMAQVLETAEKAASYEYSRVSGLSLLGPFPWRREILSQCRAGVK